MEKNSGTIKGRIKRVNKIHQREDSYDIQTKNSNFFADGTLVHNSEIVLRDREFCNLTEIVVREDDTAETLKEKVRVATILGTFQSTLTNFKYISSEWRTNCDDERLLGVSLTGILDNALMTGKNKEKLEKVLSELRQVCVEVNEEFARKLKINPSAAITCIKPSGCTTLDTKIKTSEGTKSMEELFELCGINPNTIMDDTFIEPTEDIFVFDENNDLKKVTNLYVKGLAPVVEIEDENGNVYKFSPRHRLKTKEGWKYVTDLKEDDEILSFDLRETVINTYNLSV